MNPAPAMLDIPDASRDYVVVRVRGMTTHSRSTPLPCMPPCPAQKNAQRLGLFLRSARKACPWVGGGSRLTHTTIYINILAREKRIYFCPFKVKGK